MGNCVGVHKKEDSASSAMKLKWSVGSKTVNVPIEIKETSAIGELCLGPQSSQMTHLATFQEFSKREEMFFDSQPWLDSDNEDYLSVNGDVTTPSCDSSPICQSSFIGAAQLEKQKQPFVENTVDFTTAEPSPTDVKKRLIELFHESFREDPADCSGEYHVRSEAEPFEFRIPPRSVDRSWSESAASFECGSETTYSRSSRSVKGKLGQSAQGCIPNLARSLSFSEKKKKKRLSPADGGRQ